MRLFIIPVLFGISLTTPVFATTLATANVNCITKSNTQTDISASSASCFSNAGPIYSAEASASAFNVSANAFSSNTALLPQVTSHARFEGDFILTLFGGTGPGYYFPSFHFPQWYPGTHETDNVEATFNGVTVYYKDSSNFPPIASVLAPFTFGQPIPLHIVMTANVATDGITDRGPAFISLDLAGFTAFSGDCTRFQTCVVTYGYTLVEAPEPAEALPVFTAFACGIALLRLRKQARLS